MRTMCICENSDVLKVSVMRSTLAGFLSSRQASQKLP